MNSHLLATTQKGERSRERRGTERGGKDEGDQGGESEAQAMPCTPQDRCRAKATKPPSFTVSACCMIMGFLPVLGMMAFCFLMGADEGDDYVDKEASVCFIPNSILRL